MHTEIGLRIWGTNILWLQFYVYGNLDFLCILRNCKGPFIFTQHSSYFSCCHDKMSDKKQVKEEFVLTHSLEGTVQHGGRVCGRSV